MTRQRDAVIPRSFLLVSSTIEKTIGFRGRAWQDTISCAQITIEKFSLFATAERNGTSQKQSSLINTHVSHVCSFPAVFIEHNSPVLLSLGIAAGAQLLFLFFAFRIGCVFHRSCRFLVYRSSFLSLSFVGVHFCPS